MRKLTQLFASKQVETSPTEHLTPCVVSKDTIETVLDHFLNGYERMQHVQYDPSSAVSVRAEDGTALLNFEYKTPDNKPIFFCAKDPFVLYEIVKQPTVTGKIQIPDYDLCTKIGMTEDEYENERDKYGEWRGKAEKQIERVWDAFKAASNITRDVDEKDVTGPNYFVDLFRKVQEVLTVTYTVNLAGLVRAASRAVEELDFHKVRGFSDPECARDSFVWIADNKDLAHQGVWTGTNLSEKIVGELRYRGFVAGYYTQKPEAQKSEDKKEEEEVVSRA